MLLSHYIVARLLDTVVTLAQFNASGLGKACTAASGKHACTQQSADRTSASVRLSNSCVTLDPYVEDGFFFFFGVWVRRIGPIFSLPQLAFDLTSTPTLPYSSQHDHRSHSQLPPGNISSILFAKHVSFEHSVSSPCPVSSPKREENINNTVADPGGGAKGPCPPPPLFRRASFFSDAEQCVVMCAPCKMSDRACHMHARRLRVGLRDLLHVSGSAEAARAWFSGWVYCVDLHA